MDRIETFEYGYVAGIGPSPGSMEYGDIPFIVAVGVSPPSGSASGSGGVFALVFVKAAGHWEDAIVYVKAAGHWEDAEVFVKSGGSWTL